MCLSTDDKQHYAMKIMNKRKLKRKFMGRGKNAYHLVENELAILKQIVSLYRILTTTVAFFLSFRTIRTASI